MRNPILSSIWPHFVILLVFFRFLLVGRRDVGLDGACLETREAVVSGRLSRERSPLCGRPSAVRARGLFITLGVVCACVRVGVGCVQNCFFSGAPKTVRDPRHMATPSGATKRTRTRNVVETVLANTDFLRGILLGNIGPSTFAHAARVSV
jgi:hypothetical protein